MEVKIFVFCFLLLFCFSRCQNDLKKEEVNETASQAQEVDSVSIKNQNTKWKGIWEREGAINSATLAIKEVDVSSFDFTLTTNDGANIEEISGKAEIEGTLALYLFAKNGDTCQINFVHQDSVLNVNQPVSCDSDHEIDLSGDYFLDNYLKEKVMNEDAEERKEREKSKLP